MGTITISITIIAISAIAGCGILANSLRHRRKELNEATIAYSKVLAEKERMEVFLDKSRVELKDMSTELSDVSNAANSILEQRDEWKVRAQAAEKRLRFAHQRHPKTKALLPMGTNPDGTKV